jgi:hypothetical protein
VPPRRILQNVTDDLLMEGRGAAARESFNALVAGYGAPPDSTRWLNRIAEVEKQPPPTETVESLLATPFPTPEEARAYIGRWAGESRMDEEAPPVPHILHIWIENGRVIGETENPNAPPEFRRIRWEYFKVTPNGITWGNMNGMRPRGMILSEATLQGDVLSGQIRWGGIRFTGPRGDGGPVRRFSYKRVK